MRPLTSISARRTQAGEVKLMTLVLLVAVLAGGYFLWVWGPLAIDHYTVKRRCSEALNSTWRHADPQRTREVFLRKARAVAQEEVYVGAVVQRRPAINPAPSDLRVELDRSFNPPILSIEAAYPRTVELPYLDREHTFWFSLRCEQDLGAVIWE